MDNNYTRVFEIKKKRSMSKILLYLAIFLILIGGTVYVAYSVYINIKNVSDVSVNSQKWYAISLASSSNKGELEAKHAQAVALGASGYVYEIDNIYYLIALIYPTIDEAQSVVASNKSQEYDLSIVEITFNKIEYDLKDFSKSDIDFINEVENFIYDLAKSLYDLTISVHISQISPIACANSVNTLKSELMTRLNKLNLDFDIKNTQNLQKLQDKLTHLINLLDKMVNELLTNTSDNLVIKYNFCEFIFQVSH